MRSSKVINAVRSMFTTAAYLKVLVRMCIRRSHSGVMVAVMLLAGCASSSRSADGESGRVTPIPPAAAQSNPLQTLNPRPAAPVLNTGNFPLAPGSTTPPGAPRPPPSAGEFANTAAFGANMKIDLSAEERRVLLRLIRDAMDSTKYPLAPELNVLRDLADKLHGEENPKAPPRSK
jgi:hypothetical protein